MNIFIFYSVKIDREKMIKLKRVYKPKEKDDGFRILVDRSL
ncbi:MAG: hypothetical protein PHU74_03220 [Candidatus Pacebacteria bacterium]|nr:hypothetical protein [Candidatus Paceibacterota bacterium]